MNEKIKEVLNSVDCIYEPKMLIELIRWQHEGLQKQAVVIEWLLQQHRIDYLENALSGSPDLTTNGGTHV